MRLINEAVHDVFSNGDALYFRMSETEGGESRYVRLSGAEAETITKDAYFKGLYGVNARFIMHYMKEKPASSSFSGDGSVYVCPHHESIIYKFDKNGSLVRKYHEMKKSDNIKDIAVQGESIWCVYTGTHTVIRFSLKDGKEELVLSESLPGGKTGTEFTYPESLTLQDGAVFVADRGNRRVTRTDLATMETENYMAFPDPVYRYERVDGRAYILLDSDLYLLQDEE